MGILRKIGLAIARVNEKEIKTRNELMTLELVEELRKRIADKEAMLRQAEEQINNLKDELGYKKMKAQEKEDINKQEMRIRSDLSFGGNKVLRNMQPNEPMTSKDIQALLLCKKTKAWTTMQELVRKSYCTISSNKRNRYILLKPQEEKPVGL